MTQKLEINRTDDKDRSMDKIDVAATPIPSVAAINGSRDLTGVLNDRTTPAILHNLVLTVHPNGISVSSLLDAGAVVIGRVLINRVEVPIEHGGAWDVRDEHLPCSLIGCVLEGVDTVLTLRTDRQLAPDPYAAGAKVRIL